MRKIEWHYWKNADDRTCHEQLTELVTAKAIPGFAPGEGRENI
jgi:hypothetical protein